MIIMYVYILAYALYNIIYVYTIDIRYIYIYVVARKPYEKLAFLEKTRLFIMR